MPLIDDVAYRLRTVNQEQVAAFLRTAGQVISGITGWAWLNDNAWISGASFLFLGVVTLWGLFARRDAALIESAANVPVVQKIEAAAPVAATIHSSKVVPASTLALAFLFLLTPFLAGCVQTRAAVVPPSGATVTRADIRVYEASQKIVQYCDALRFAVGVAQWFAQEPQHQVYVQRAQGVVGAYCAYPPSDVRTALHFLTIAYDEIMAVPGVQAEVRQSSLIVAKR